MFHKSVKDILIWCIWYLITQILVVVFLLLTISLAFGIHFVLHAYKITILIEQLYYFSLSDKINGPWKLVRRQATVYNWLTEPEVDTGTSQSKK